MKSSVFASVLLAALGSSCLADPCGMVPPISTPGDISIARAGLQRTYVFYQNGVESFVIRPGYTGDVQDFGMLIPFPTPPAIRKVPDSVFSQIPAAIDPPHITIDLNPRPTGGFFGGGFGGAGGSGGGGNFGGEPEPLVIRVINEEAIGMYEVAVLEAGSAKALQKWMTDHNYKYPAGMDKVCEEYIEQKWCFVAVKTKVGLKSKVEPKPGMRKAEADRPFGSVFDGQVQAMGFRFKSQRLVVPMRLSAFNKGDTRNVIYLLGDAPAATNHLTTKFVQRQIPGTVLYRNLTGPLPVLVVNSRPNSKWQRQFLREQMKAVAPQRDPAPHNGVARELFASDLLSVRENRLVHPHEESEKMYLRISERFGLRGAEIDTLHENSLQEQRTKTLAKALEPIKPMTMTVIDGDLPRSLIANQNLTFRRYQMPNTRNNPESYHATEFGPRPQPKGIFTYATVSQIDAVVPAGPESLPVVEALPSAKRTPVWSVVTLFSACCLGGFWWRRR